MPIERETIIERPAESRETVVTTDNSASLIVGIIVAVLAVLALLWLFNGGLNGGDVNVDLPNVTVTD
jgi:hypothetical protein